MNFQEIESQIAALEFFRLAHLEQVIKEVLLGRVILPDRRKLIRLKDFRKANLISYGIFPRVTDFLDQFLLRLRIDRMDKQCDA